MSRFLRNKRDIFLSLQRDNETIMNVTKEIRRRIAGFSEDYVFTASDFEIETQNQSAVVWRVKILACITPAATSAFIVTLIPAKSWS